MAQFFGQRGKYSVYMIRISAVAALLYVLLGVYFFVHLVNEYQGRLFDPLLLVPLILITGPVFVIIYVLYRKYDKITLNFLAGLKGEEDIAPVLKTLPDDYSVYVDVKIKPEFGNIDYVVIGPTGLFTIEVKSHRGIISFNGSELVRRGKKLEKNFLKQSMSEAMSLHEYLKERLEADIFIKPVIVFSSWVKINFGLNPVRNVFVVQKQWLEKLLESQPPYRFPVARDLIEQRLKSLAIR